MGDDTDDAESFYVVCHINADERNNDILLKARIKRNAVAVAASNNAAYTATNRDSSITVSYNSEKDDLKDKEGMYAPNQGANIE